MIEFFPSSQNLKFIISLTPNSPRQSHGVTKTDNVHSIKNSLKYI